MLRTLRVGALHGKALGLVRARAGAVWASQVSPIRLYSQGPRPAERGPATGAASTSTSSSSESSGSTSSGTSSPSSSGSGLLLALAGAAAAFFAARAYYKTEPRGGSLIRDLSTPKYGGHDEFKQALPELENAIGEDHVTTDENELHRHGYSEWSTFNSDVLPIVIVYPSTTEEVSAIAKICHKYKLPMIGFSGGSSLEGNISALYGGVCIDFARMDKIIAVRPDDMDCTVQPSVGWVDLNAHLAKLNTGLFFAVDPGPTAQIGGMVATSCSGTNCVKYGPMRNHVINLTVVLADGTVVKTRQRPRKTAAGYNLNHLFSGSEGTLGLITEITVKLEVVPETTTVAVSSFPSVKAATAAATAVMRKGIPVNAIELMDDVLMSAVNKAGATGRSWPESTTLFLKFSGTDKYVKEQISQTQVIANNHGSTSFEFARNKDEEHKLWAARKEVLWSMIALGPEKGAAWSTDVAVPVSKLADAVEKAKKEIEASGIYGGVLGHVGDGNYHACLIYAPDQKDTVRELAKHLVYDGLALEGTCTGEHGIGAGKVKYLADELGSEAILLMRTMKLALDPHELLNPGKIFSVETIANKIQQENGE